jgi:hypothetical protein
VFLQRSNGCLFFIGFSELCIRLLDVIVGVRFENPLRRAWMV